MPATASLEDLKAAQKEGLSIYAMLSALCSMLYGNMAPHRMEKCVWSPTDKRVTAYLTPVWGDIPRLISGQAGQELVAFCCRGKLWLEERTPEQLKGEGG